MTRKVATRPRIAFVVSHAINYFCAQYRSLGGLDAWDLKVFFASSIGKSAYHDKNLGERARAAIEPWSTEVAAQKMVDAVLKHRWYRAR
jgi:hypothetical protein